MALIQKLQISTLPNPTLHLLFFRHWISMLPNPTLRLLFFRHWISTLQAIQIHRLRPPQHQIYQRNQVHQKRLEKCGQDCQTPQGNIYYSVKYWLILHLLRLLRNLCAHDWIQSNPLGTTAEFKIYYGNLSTKDKKVCPGSCRNC